MAQLTNPINAQNIIDRFADFVPPAANQGIAWGTNAVPFGEMSTTYFGGDTSGKAIGVSGSNLTASSSTITGQTIYDVLLAETQTYARIRRMRAVLYVEGGGGNTGSRPTPGVIYDATAMSHLNNDYKQTIQAGRSDLYTNNPITASGLETIFTNMRDGYNAVRDSVATIQINVCHASCHSSCHSSRGRR